MLRTSYAPFILVLYTANHTFSCKCRQVARKIVKKFLFICHAKHTYHPYMLLLDYISISSDSMKWSRVLVSILTSSFTSSSISVMEREGGGSSTMVSGRVGAG